MSSNALQNLVRIEDPDAPVFRTLRMKWFRKMFEQNALVLVMPDLWDDPFENIIQWCAITYTNESKWRQEFLHQVRRPMFAQCWSHTYESDAIWRVYSTVSRDPNTGLNTTVDEEGLKIRTTPRKLIDALWKTSPTDPLDSCFLGEIRYLPERDITQYIADEIGRERINAFSNGRGHAETLLLKREPFEHEREIRLIYVGQRTDSMKFFNVPIDPNELIDEIILDPRLQPDDVRQREEVIRTLGYNGKVERSNLYQKKGFEIIIK
jgi:hypothetical protein